MNNMKVPDLNSHLQMSFLTYNGEIITLLCKVREDDRIECGPFPKNATIIDYQLKEKTMDKKELNSEITFTYKSFTTRVCWDNVKCFWFLGWIYGKDYLNIFKEPPYILTGKYIQELQAKFEDYIDNYLFMQRNTPKENLKNLTDSDVALVKEFIASLNKVANEMELLDEDEYSGTVLSVKLKKVYDEYKDRVMPSSSFESFIDYYSYLQSKKEEERKEKANKEYNDKLLILKKENENKLNDLYEEYREVLGFVKRDTGVK